MTVDQARLWVLACTVCGAATTRTYVLPGRDPGIVTARCADHAPVAGDDRPLD